MAGALLFRCLYVFTLIPQQSKIIFIFWTAGWNNHKTRKSMQICTTTGGEWETPGLFLKTGISRPQSLDEGSDGATAGDQWDGFWWLWPVDDATHVDLQVAVISQQSLLHHKQVHRLVVHTQQTHAALKDVEGIFTPPTVVVGRTTWTGTESSYSQCRKCEMTAGCRVFSSNNHYSVSKCSQQSKYRPSRDRMNTSIYFLSSSVTVERQTVSVHICERQCVWQLKNMPGLRCCREERRQKRWDLWESSCEEARAEWNRGRREKR